jgi:hypothetical protein
MKWWTELRAWCGEKFRRLKHSRAELDAAEINLAKVEFHQRREWLEARFFDIAAGSGRPRGLRWTEIDFEDAVTYARQLTNRELCAFVGVTISFEAIEGGDMEEVEAVGRKRAATAVFRLNDGVWATDGRVLFNLTPADALQYFKHDLVVLA